MININMKDNENRIAVEIEGTMSTIMSDLTHIIHGIVHAIADHYEDESEKKRGVEMFKKLFMEGVVSGIFMETDDADMEKMIAEANHVHKLHNQLDKIQVGVMTLDDLVSALKKALNDDDEPDGSESEEETPIIDMEERLAKAINDFHHDHQPEEPENPTEEENHEAE